MATPNIPARWRSEPYTMPSPGNTTAATSISSLGLSVPIPKPWRAARFSAVMGGTAGSSDSATVQLWGSHIEATPWGSSNAVLLGTLTPTGALCDSVVLPDDTFPYVATLCTALTAGSVSTYVGFQAA